MAEARKLINNRLYRYVGPGHQLGLKTGEVCRYYGQHETGPHEVFLRNGMLAHVDLKDIGEEVPAWHDEVSAVPLPVSTAATILTFKRSGKWYATGRGVVSREVYIETHETPARRRMILEQNGGKCPGLSSAGAEFTWIVLPDHAADGFPLMLVP